MALRISATRSACAFGIRFSPQRGSRSTAFFGGAFFAGVGAEANCALSWRPASSREAPAFFFRSLAFDSQKRWSAAAQASSEAAAQKAEAEAGALTFFVEGREVLLATTPSIPGCAVLEFKGLVEGTSVRGRSALDIWRQQLQQQLGGEQRLLQGLLRETRRAALERLAVAAAACGANAVVGVRLVTSGLQRMHVEYTAYGTAVRVSAKA